MYRHINKNCSIKKIIERYFLIYKEYGINERFVLYFFDLVVMNKQILLQSEA